MIMIPLTMKEKTRRAKPSVLVIGNTFPVTGIVLVELLLIVTALSSPVSAASADDSPVALPGCDDHCGDVKIPYPFGVDFEKCALNPWFTVNCSKQYNPPTPLLPKLIWTQLLLEQKVFYSPPPYGTIGGPVTNISFGATSSDNTLSIKGSFAKLEFSGEKLYAWKSLSMVGAPYRLMGAGRNVLLVGGCSGGAVVVRDSRNETVAGCATACIKNPTTPIKLINKACYGLECCQSAIPTSQDSVEMYFLNFLNQSVSENVSAALVDLSYLSNRFVDKNLSAFAKAPTLLQWRVDDLPINSPEYANSLCVKDGTDGGFTCTCKREYHHGNPYLPNGCRAIKTCQQCPDDCIYAGNNTFRCPLPLTPPPSSSPSPDPMPRELIVGIGITLASVFTLAVLSTLYQLLKKRKEVMKKKNNFKRNGGLLLHQQTRTSDGSIERTKLFASNELEKATDDFNENRVLGRGGQGTVYKGMLVDGTIVAIKKSKNVSERQLQQFINEVVILSQINRRNVVKLFGCCLETDVPLLIYEYVPNGTLYQHLHNPHEDFRITWKMRLQIAMESAEVLAYLHSWSFSPIYHRDIKTSNILLDEKYKAKVSDFGTSKTLSIDQTHITTEVQGTIGYLDPEFLQSSQFTEKSDVYSFGIVLLELLTSKKAVYLDNHEEPKRLASEFLAAMENSHLYDLVDAQVLDEAREQEIEGVADLARRCLNLNGRERPTMKEVAMTLLIIRAQNQAPNTSQQDFITRDKVIVDQICTNNGGSLSFSSTYGPR